MNAPGKSDHHPFSAYLISDFDKMSFYPHLTLSLVLSILASLSGWLYASKPSQANSQSNWIASPSPAIMWNVTRISGFRLSAAIILVTLSIVVLVSACVRPSRTIKLPWYILLSYEICFCLLSIFTLLLLGGWNLVLWKAIPAESSYWVLMVAAGISYRSFVSPMCLSALRGFAPLATVSNIFNLSVHAGCLWSTSNPASIESAVIFISIIATISQQLLLMRTQALTEFLGIGESMLDERQIRSKGPRWVRALIWIIFGTVGFFIAMWVFIVYQLRKCSNFKALRPCIYFTFPLMQAPYCSCAGLQYSDSEVCSPYSTVHANEMLNGLLVRVPTAQGLWLSNTNMSLHCPDFRGFTSLARLDSMVFLSIKSTNAWRLPEVPGSIWHMDQLIGLELTGVGLTELPENITALSQLQYLNISQNMIGSVTASTQRFLANIYYPAIATGNGICNDHPSYLTC